MIVKCPHSRFFGDRSHNKRHSLEFRRKRAEKGFKKVQYTNGKSVPVSMAHIWQKKTKTCCWYIKKSWMLFLVDSLRRTDKFIVLKSGSRDWGRNWLSTDYIAAKTLKSDLKLHFQCQNNTISGIPLILTVKYTLDSSVTALKTLLFPLKKKWYDQGFPWEHLGWKGAAVKGSVRGFPPIVQEYRGPTATELTAALWPTLETTRCTATGCWNRGASARGGSAPKLKGRVTGAGETRSRWHWLVLWVCCGTEFSMCVLRSFFLVSGLFLNGVWRKTSGSSVDLWAPEKEELRNAIMLPFSGALKGASWKTSGVTRLSWGWNWGSCVTGIKWKLGQDACLGWWWMLRASDSSMCWLLAREAVLCWIICVCFSLVGNTEAAGLEARSSWLLSSLCRSVWKRRETGQTGAHSFHLCYRIKAS